MMQPPVTKLHPKAIARPNIKAMAKWPDHANYYALLN